MEGIFYGETCPKKKPWGETPRLSCK